MKNIYLPALAIATTLFATTTAANAAITAPTTAQPGRVQERFNDGPKIKTTDEVIIQSEEPQNDADNAGEIFFVLKSINIEGNSVFQNGEVEDVYNDKIGERISLEELYQIRDGITKLYREEGYVLSRAILPPQSIKGGDLKIRIIEGKIGNIILQNEEEIKGNRKIIDKYISKMKSDGPLNSNNLERYLLLMNDLYGTEANAVLRPSDTSGATDLVISFGHDFVEGIISYDNGGTKFIGEKLISTEFSTNSIFSLSEQVSFRAIADDNFDEIAFGDFTYRVPVSYEGTELKFNMGISRTTPGSTLKSLEIVGKSKVFEVELSHPIIRTRRENLSARVALNITDTKSESLSINIFDDRTRVITLGGTYDYADTYGGVNLIDLAVHQGIDFLGESSDGAASSRANGSAEFTKFTLELVRRQEINDDLTFLFSSRGQYALDALLVGEEFGLGGDIGRGFDFSEIVGDHGFGASFELQHGVLAESEYLNDYQFFMFYDIGAVWQEDKIVGEVGRDSLASTGVGVRFNFVEDFSSYIQLAKPLTRPVASEGDDDARLHFGVNWLF